MAGLWNNFYERGEGQTARPPDRQRELLGLKSLLLVVGMRHLAYPPYIGGDRAVWRLCEEEMR